MLSTGDWDDVTSLHSVSGSEWTLCCFLDLVERRRDFWKAGTNVVRRCFGNLIFEDSYWIVIIKLALLTCFIIEGKRSSMPSDGIT
ncbi:hypothetical protein TNCV_2400611 [Trichonephila clavipes]|nr:hypothetical protein TNCV_2400611 [Trichonephila clavipes]